MKARNIVLTGVPRSGTTLTCHLLNTLADTVALHEPMFVKDMGRVSGHGAVCRQVERFFEETRASLLAQGVAPSKVVEGHVPDNSVGGRTSTSELRRSRANRGTIKVEKPLTDRFTLCVKHPSAFTAMLDALANRLPCYAIIRNPLSVLASWNSVQFPVQRGHAPAAERLDQKLRETLAGLEDCLDRQLHLLSWFFGKYASVLPREHVVPYEKIVATGGAALAVITPEAAALCEKLECRNRNHLYDQELMPVLARKLLASDGAYWKFYSKQSVTELFEGDTKVTGGLAA